MLPFLAAIGLFLTLALLWLGERLAGRDQDERSSRHRLPPGPPRS
jgi:hypothetical protein